MSSKFISQHGVLVRLLDKGVLITGKSGLGKSECAVELLYKGAFLVADDVVLIKQDNEELIGSPPETIKNLIEIRGIGIINVKDIFGEKSIIENSKIDLMIELIDYKDNLNYERLGYDTTYIQILNSKIPHMKIPVGPGRNLSTLIEIAVKKIILET
jgi:HPr kinase/phosphorylase